MSNGLSMVEKLKQRMQDFTRPLFLGVSLVMLALSVLLMADVLGLRTNPDDAAHESRRVVVESLAVQLSTLASVSELPIIKDAVHGFKGRNDQVASVSLVRNNGIVVSELGDMAALAKLKDEGSDVFYTVPILNRGQSWGELQIAFAELNNRWNDLLWFGFFTLSALAAFTTFLGRALVQIDPNRAVPGRVESAMNLFSAGVFVLDAKLRIVMTNTSGIALVEPGATELIGKQLEDWKWNTEAGWQAPWKTTLNSGLAVSDEPLTLIMPDGSERSLLVSCAFVGDTGRKGVLVTLDDMTTVERQNSELTTMLAQLQESQDVITAQNHELMLLATTDPLTGIANRRTLMERLESNFESAVQNNTKLSCIMTDIDHFKSVNDNYGHGVGDDVIKAVATAIGPLCRDVDIVGRYGGEEFVVILPGLDAEEAAVVAEKARVAVFALAEGDLLAVPKLSSSFGVADLTSGAKDGDALVDAADQALYGAKQGGRNQVSIYDENSVVLEAASAPKESDGRESAENDDSAARINNLEKMLDSRDLELNALRELDPHTGVPLRTLFLRKIDDELERSYRAGSMVAVMSIAIGKLDALIERRGHDVTDELVTHLLNRLQDGLRSTDMVSLIETNGGHLSRIASDEFGVVLTALEHPSNAMVIISRIKRLLQAPFEIDGEQELLCVDIGVSLSSPDQIGTEALYPSACSARRVAHGYPENISHAFSSTALQKESVEYMELEADLYDALEAGEIETWYQPKFDLKERRVSGFEALLRWNHKTKGFIDPPVFIAVAEANGLIDKLSQFIMVEALRQLRVWHSMGYEDLGVAINVSPTQLRADTLVAETLNALEATGASGRHLEIELTETFLASDPEQANIALNTLREQGVNISLDNFGRGYTSLTTLAGVPLDLVKIDRSYVSKMCDSVQSQNVMSSLINMAHALDLRVVGEGVETNEQLQIMSDMGCDEAQGYLISRPQNSDKITEFLVHQRSSEQARRAS